MKPTPPSLAAYSLQIHGTPPLTPPTPPHPTSLSLPPPLHSHYTPQLYVNSNRKKTRALVEKAERAGCSALFITVDAPQVPTPRPPPFAVLCGVRSSDGGAARVRVLAPIPHRCVRSHHLTTLLYLSPNSILRTAWEPREGPPRQGDALRGQRPEQGDELGDE